MDYKKVLEECNARVEMYQKSEDAWNVWHLFHERQCATAITDLLSRAEKAERERDEAVHDRMVMEQRTAELVARAEAAETWAEASDARAELAEARAEEAERERDQLREAMKPNCLLCDSMHPDNGNCTAVGGFCTAVPAAHCPLIPRLRDKLETAEKCIAEIEEAIKFGRYSAAMLRIFEYRGQKEE